MTQGEGRRAAVRADVQALRAVAVLLVIADHLTVLPRLPGHPEGGFVGVDVFFVISGFLITGHLVREVRRTGRVSYRDFYAARARRILPMAALVAVVSVVAGHLLLWRGPAWDATVDGLWALGFLANVRFAVQGTDYFAATQQSLFQHYWSLSVEEQFYLLWPVLVAGAVWLAVRRGTRPGTVLVAATSAVALTSLVWACVETASSPTAAYFSTFSRAFEFAVGGLLAVLAPRCGAVPGVLRRPLAWLGFAVIAASVVLIGPEHAFPGPWALLPVLGTALVLVAGTGTERDPTPWPLRNRLVGLTGDISYSLYLWHWPVIVLVGTVVPRSTLAFYVLAAGATALLSVVSYHAVEQPVRRSSWLRATASNRPAPPRPAPPRRSRVLRSPVLRSTAAMAGTLALVAVAAVGAVDVVRAAPQGPAAAPLERQLDEPAAAARLVDVVQAQIARARLEDSWAPLEPPVDDLAERSPLLRDPCWNDRHEVGDVCVIGPADAQHTVALLGDSLAMSWVEALHEAVLAEPDWNITLLAKVGCPFADADVVDTDGSAYRSCERFRDAAIDRVREDRPDVVVLASGLRRDMFGAASDESYLLAWEAGVARTLRRIGDAAGQVLVLSPPPEGADLRSCASRLTVPSMCVARVSDLWQARAEVTSEVVREAGGVYVNTALWFCSPDGRCPAVIGRTPVLHDGVHMTVAYSRSLGPLVRAWLLAAVRAA